MKQVVLSFVSGLIFGFGLSLGGMTKPERVISFLDVTGNWDPSLMFVMFGALVIYASLYQVAKRMKKPFLAPNFTRPNRTVVDRPLVVGAVLFGAGWGLVGYCPAPAITSLPSLKLAPALFVTSLLLGMWLFQRFGAAKP